MVLTRAHSPFVAPDPSGRPSREVKGLGQTWEACLPGYPGTQFLTMSTIFWFTFV
jgi:hypothetical protein